MYYVEIKKRMNDHWDGVESGSSLDKCERKLALALRANAPCEGRIVTQQQRDEEDL
jgi:hypothetical protein